MAVENQGPFVFRDCLVDRFLQFLVVDVIDVFQNPLLVAGIPCFFQIVGDSVADSHSDFGHGFILIVSESLGITDYPGYRSNNRYPDSIDEQFVCVPVGHRKQF